MNTSTSVNVGYQYASGSSNTIRPTALVYPNGRVLTYGYGTSAGIDDALSRIASLIDNDGVTHLADYARIGRDTFVQQSSPQPQIAWTLINGTTTDPYTGLDQFNRVVDNRWYSTATNSDLDRIQHGYDRASNRLWRRNTVAAAVSANLDELYAYDGLYRLAEMQRGQLNGPANVIVSGTSASRKPGGSMLRGIGASSGGMTPDHRGTCSKHVLQTKRMRLPPSAVEAGRSRPTTLRGT